MRQLCHISLMIDLFWKV